MRRFSLLILSLVILGLPALSLAAEAFPSKQLTYVVTFDPGGQSDREARRQQGPLAKILGQQVIVDYKVGGGGALGWKELVRSKPDGYTFVGINTPHIILQPLQQEVGYKTNQINPVALFQRTPLALAVLKESPYATLKDFVEAARKEPGTINIGGSAVFSGHHFATLRLQKMAGIKLNYIPFTGSAPQMTSFLGGHTNAVMANSDDLVRFADKLRVLAFASDERFPLFPDVPTFKEQGYDMTDSIDRGVAVPMGTPPEVVAVLEKAFLQIMGDPEIQKAMRADGFVPLAMGHEESKAYIAKLTDLYTGLAKELKGN
jgi:tripartite-type tricarboxylate transporter receptor subunit TctC